MNLCLPLCVPLVETQGPTLVPANTLQFPDAGGESIQFPDAGGEYMEHTT
jgi:hypothetical protein